DDLDMHPRVVVDPEPRDGVDVRRVPPALELRVVVDALEDAAELAIAAHRHVDPHLRDRLLRGQARLALGFGRDGLLDPFLGLGVERHAVRLPLYGWSQTDVQRTSGCSGAGGVSVAVSR